MIINLINLYGNCFITYYIILYYIILYKYYIILYKYYIFN